MYHIVSPPDPRHSNAADRPGSWTCDDVIAFIAREKGVPKRILIHRARCRARGARARQLAMYLSHVVLGRTIGEIATAFGRHRTTVSYACAVIEDLRDNSAFDAEVQQLEDRLEACCKGAWHGAH